MKNSVVIKGNAYGIVAILDKDIPFKELLDDISKKFRESAKFFKNAKMAITFEGRQLTEEQEREILNIISDSSDLEILCIVDKDAFKEQVFKEAVEDKLAQMASHDGQFYKGTLRSGQVFEAETSVVILGDVNPGATVISTGNIVVLGALKGIAYAGGNGNESAFVVALEMKPVQIRIGDIIARCSDEAPARRKKKEIMEPKIAFVEDGNIYIEPVSKDILNDINL